ncbi:MAG: hypothetical protein IH602_15700 [Bryobacteraceae bacterium]|jgi:hypothetical protein|nr:hypothetical protein [Bryobacteraceae bacterium]
MNKRLLKTHKRKVARQRDRAKQTEPDLRTPEEIKAAKEASRPAGGYGAGPTAFYSRSSAGGHANPASHSASKTDV